jgi:hypothetical protein
MSGSISIPRLRLNREANQGGFLVAGALFHLGPVAFRTRGSSSGEQQSPCLRWLNAGRVSRMAGHGEQGRHAFARVCSSSS